MHVMVSSNCIDASVGSVEICISFSATKHIEKWVKSLISPTFSNFLEKTWLTIMKSFGPESGA